MEAGLEPKTLSTSLVVLPPVSLRLWPHSDVHDDSQADGGDEEAPGEANSWELVLGEMSAAVDVPVVGCTELPPKKLNAVHESRLFRRAWRGTSTAIDGLTPPQAGEASSELVRFIFLPPKLSVRSPTRTCSQGAGSCSAAEADSEPVRTCDSRLCRTTICGRIRSSPEPDIDVVRFDVLELRNEWDASGGDSRSPDVIEPSSPTASRADMTRVRGKPAYALAGRPGNLKPPSSTAAASANSKTPALEARSPLTRGLRRVLESSVKSEQVDESKTLLGNELLLARRFWPTSVCSISVPSLRKESVLGMCADSGGVCRLDALDETAAQSCNGSLPRYSITASYVTSAQL